VATNTNPPAKAYPEDRSRTAVTLSPNTTMTRGRSVAATTPITAKTDRGSGPLGSAPEKPITASMAERHTTTAAAAPNAAWRVGRSHGEGSAMNPVPTARRRIGRRRATATDPTPKTTANPHRTALAAATSAA
jgi:hypothetical protein